MQSSTDKDLCPCPPISHPPYPLSSSSHLPTKDVSTKYYQEIGAEMISNQLIIRLERDKNKSRKKRGEWDPPCDCVEIQRPTSKTGPKIINADYDDRIVFRVHSASRLYGKEDSIDKTQVIAYKVGSCRDEQDSHRCKTITVYPQIDSESQQVYSDHITENNQDIFLLRIKKKAESSEQKDRNVELELRTPKPPIPLVSSMPSTSPASAVASSQPVTDLVVKTEKELNTAEKSNTIEEITQQSTKALKHNKMKKRKTLTSYK